MNADQNKLRLTKLLIFPLMFFQIRVFRVNPRLYSLSAIISDIHLTVDEVTPVPQERSDSQA